MERSYDFTRCVRPNGTAYGTAGQCRSGVEEEKQAIDKLLSLLPQGEKVIDSAGGVHSTAIPRKVSEEDLRETASKRSKVLRIIERERKILKKFSKAKKYEGSRLKREQRLKRLEDAYRKLNSRYLEQSAFLDAESQRSGLGRPLI